MESSANRFAVHVLQMLHVLQYGGFDGASCGGVPSQRTVVSSQKPTPFVWVRGQALGLDPSASPPSPEGRGGEGPSRRTTRIAIQQLSLPYNGESWQLNSIPKQRGLRVTHGLAVCVFAPKCVSEHTEGLCYCAPHP